MRAAVSHALPHPCDLHMAAAKVHTVYRGTGGYRLVGRYNQRGPPARKLVAAAEEDDINWVR